MMTVDELLSQNRIWNAYYRLPLHSHTDNQHLYLSYTVRLLQLNGYDTTPLAERYLEFLHKCEQDAFQFRRSPTSWNHTSHDEITGMIANSLMLGLVVHKYIFKVIKENYYFYNPTKGPLPRAFMGRFVYLVAALNASNDIECGRLLSLAYEIQGYVRGASKDPGYSDQLLQWITTLSTDRQPKLKQSNECWRAQCKSNGRSLESAMQDYFKNDSIMLDLARGHSF